MTAASELRRIAIEVGRVPDSGLYAAAKLVKAVALEEGRAAGAPLMGKHRPIKLAARDKGIRPLNDGKAILVQGTPAGPWVWRTVGTAPHDIRRRKRNRAGESKLLKKMTVRNPGTRGVGAWSNVIDRAVKLVPRIFEDAVGQAVN